MRNHTMEHIDGSRGAFFGDNIQFDVTSSSREHLRTTLEMIWHTNQAKGMGVVWVRDEDSTPEGEKPICKGERADGLLNTLVFSWVNPGNKKKKMRDLPISLFPFPIKVETAYNHAIEWLEDHAEWPEEPDHDGSNTKGFRVTTGDMWGHALADCGNRGWQYFCRIEPAWIMLGK